MADHYNHGMEEVLAKRLFRRVAEALNFLHSKRCVHLDIKPENVLLIKDKDKQLVAKLRDFGDVMHFESNEKIECSDSDVGMKTYRVPEERKANNKQLYDPMAAHNFGIVLFLILTYNLEATF
jgi:serine/threonine protein kinase